ncbi:MAG TPA: peptide chain release factor N(5)-glutamine methyltransferase [Candidatus Acidoferrales bacterium]|nr:peptide chain release factor N(5)-glutamine methyltransferase [Candidatus Acidoferrales bacterium]
MTMAMPNENRATVSGGASGAMRIESAAVNVRAALRDAMARMSSAGVPSHALAAELLLMHVMGRDRAWLYAHPEAPLDAEDARRYFELVTKRAAGTPTQYLTGRQEFWGLEFEVTPAVLIPRPETEHVVEVAVERLGKERANALLRIADVGTGSGCITVALAHEFPRAEIVATDISADALAVAARNAERHNMAERVHFLECNLLDAFASARATFDMIVSNPPYVARDEEAQLPREVREHEPHEALFCGATGTEIYAPLISQAAELLRSGGLLALEIGYGALDRVRSLLDESSSWREIRVANDLAGIPRIISAERA